MHTFVWIGDWTAEASPHAITEASKTGFDFIEIPLLKPEEFNAASHKQTLKETGITATCSLVLPKDAHMSYKPQKALIFLKKVLDELEKLECTCLSGRIAYSLGTPTGKAPTQEEQQNVIDALLDLASFAKSRGIDLIIGNL